MEPAQFRRVQFSVLQRRDKMYPARIERIFIISNKHRDHFRVESLMSRHCTRWNCIGFNHCSFIFVMIVSLRFSCKKKREKKKCIACMSCVYVVINVYVCVYVCPCMCSMCNGGTYIYVFFIQTWQRLIRDLRLPAFRVCFSGLLNCWLSSMVTIQKLYWLE